MQLESLKDLEKLVKLCRKLGVDKIEVDGVKVELGAPPEIVDSRKNRISNLQENQVFIPGGIDQDTRIDMPDELTEEQKMFWSSSDSQGEAI